MDFCRSFLHLGDLLRCFGGFFVFFFWIFPVFFSSEVLVGGIKGGNDSLKGSGGWVSSSSTFFIFSEFILKVGKWLPLFLKVGGLHFGPQNVDMRTCTCWVVPLPSNSDHQDYCIFCRESQPKPSFPLLLGRGTTQCTWASGIKQPCSLTPTCTLHIIRSKQGYD